MQLRLKIGNGLIPINLLVIVLIALFPDNVARAILGLPFLLFFPGYRILLPGELGILATIIG